MIFRFFPWKFLLNRAARKYGFLDPVTFLARLRSFVQPSEVQEPIELLRAGMVFHARGLLNTKAIQHNLDWVWPYWTVRQFNPSDPSFIPRAFSFSHVNLTPRNWTAVGLPDIALYPIVDPRGLVNWLLVFQPWRENGVSLYAGAGGSAPGRRRKPYSHNPVSGRGLVRVDPVVLVGLAVLLVLGIGAYSLLKKRNP
ncbi:hypothetical protein [Desulfogranum marinum]|uniref:hypothetical protein n=1 Tax=Desulfogranum marinum TaxID=453220 RepID=UPI0019629435|nr:hypothetical protein [Desulfogranum marinum]MBM9514034.1 hypothetical protein [Desulfogranum marinum]